LFGIALLPFVLRSISIFIAGLKGLDTPRPTTSMAWASVGFHLGLGGLILWAFSAGLMTPGAIGIRVDRVGGIILFGWVGWMLVIVAGMVEQLFRVTEYRIRDFVRIQRLIWPRSISGRIGMILVLAINPITEEVIARGIMVRLVHQASDSLAAGLIVGLVVCWTTHLYQGLRSLPAHALFFGIATWLAYSEYGLLAAILCHLAVDLSVVFFSRGRMEWVRAERTKRRAAPTVASNP